MDRVILWYSMMLLLLLAGLTLIGIWLRNQFYGIDSETNVRLSSFLRYKVIQYFLVILGNLLSFIGIFGLLIQPENHSLGVGEQVAAVVFVSILVSVEKFLYNKLSRNV